MYYFVYILQSLRTKRLYIGVTSNLKKRLKEHNTGKNKATKRYTPWVLIYCEIYRSKKDALTRERKLKRYKNSLTRLKQRIKNCFL